MRYRQERTHEISMRTICNISELYSEQDSSNNGNDQKSYKETKSTIKYEVRNERETGNHNRHHINSHSLIPSISI